MVVQSGEVSREILKHHPVPKGAATELERDPLQGPGVTEQGGMASEWRRTGLDGILERDSSL